MDRPQGHTETGQTSQRNTEQGSQTHKQDPLCNFYNNLDNIQNSILNIAKESMLLSCGVGEDSWESLGLQSVLGVHWKDWYWSWNSDTLSTSCKELTLWKKTLRDWGQEEKGRQRMRGLDGITRLDGHVFEWTPGDGDGQGGLACCHGVTKSQTRLSNWTELNIQKHANKSMLLEVRRRVTLRWLQAGAWKLSDRAWACPVSWSFGCVSVSS